MNLANNLTVMGRLTADPIVFDNQDGSKKVKLKIAAKDDYKTKGEYGSQFIPVEAFLQKDSKLLPIYEGLKKGDLVAIAGSLKNNDYEKGGQKVYELIVQISNIKTDLESKAVRDARHGASVAPDVAATTPDSDTLPA